MNEQHFIPKKYKSSLQSGTIEVQSPSNIALVKYWGKYGEQLPQNASVSFTLAHCHTDTSLHYTRKERPGFQFKVLLDGAPEPKFEPKIQKFFERIETYVPFINDYSFRIETSNSFPHSSGIASSASGMSALALALVCMEQSLISSPHQNASLGLALGNQNASEGLSKEIERKASFLARLGSGSAARSLAGPLVVWGTHPAIEGSTNLFGTTYNKKVHSNFKQFQDTILLVDKGEKQVSSTVGHNLMHNHPYAEQRFATANHNLTKLISIFESGNLTAFMEVVESEALQLHAMMMASTPYFILMKPNTLEIINRIWAFRKETQCPVCFTLDAGANVHVLYPNSEKDRVREFIASELAVFCKNGSYIHDETGLGAQVVSRQDNEW